jgi:hypothetical protein
MYTIENNFNEMKSVAASKGINTKGLNKAAIINALNELEPVVVVEAPTLGRKINPESIRQIRLAEMEARKVDGVIKRGRPSNPESIWFKRQAELNSKRDENGVMTLGRQINPDSARQKRLALKGTLPLGRPKAVVVEAPVVEVPNEVPAPTEVEIEEVFVGNA